jgi:hypothetical protein
LTLFHHSVHLRFHRWVSLSIPFTSCVISTPLYDQLLKRLLAFKGLELAEAADSGKGTAS